MLRRMIFFAFLLAAVKANAQQTSPVLISHVDSTRAIAFDSVTRTREPFTTATTRIMLFAMKLALPPGETLIAEAEDALIISCCQASCAVSSFMRASMKFLHVVSYANVCDNPCAMTMSAPITGTIERPFASTQAIASCDGRTPLAAASCSRTATRRWLRSRFSPVNLGR